MTSCKGLWLAGAMALSASMAQAQDTIKIGVLHSLAGTMAISETTLKDTMLMLIAEQNAKGGVLGTDHVNPRTTNNILEAYLMSKGIDYGR